MALHLIRELDALKQHLLGYCALVERSTALAVRAMEQQDRELARQVIEGDLDIDRREVRIEEEALKLLALYQPVAVDLRFLVATIKINRDLERIGDLAVNIAERADRLAAHPRLHPYMDFTVMAGKALAMVRKSLDALLSLDVDMAERVCGADDDVDALHEETYKRVEAALNQPERDVEFLIAALGVSRDLERIADHATNIAQDVIYLASGSIIRHRDGDKEQADS